MNSLVGLELTQAASSDLRELIRLVIGARSRSVFQEYMVRQFRLRRTVGRRYISENAFTVRSMGPRHYRSTGDWP